jgi:PHP family Zn ribbon phosphoesterase
MLKADLHIHTLLSPCGDLEMTPVKIVQRAREKGLDIIGVTDHNSTLMAREVQKVAAREGIVVLCGAEITTKEEVHVVAFVEGEQNLVSLQKFLDEKIARVQNNPDIFGYQPVVDENEQVVEMVEHLLISAVDASVDEISDFVYSLDGIFVPAHVDKSANSLMSQLGFIPPFLKADALELSFACDVERFVADNSSFLKGRSFLTSSDAHYLEEIGRCHTKLDMDSYSFAELRSALNNSGIENFAK